MITTTSEQLNTQVGSTDDFLIQPQGTEIILSDKQQEVHDKLLNFAIERTREPFAVFKGYAGVGKSTVTTRLIASLKQFMPAGRIGVAAPTHKAVKVLRRHSIEGIGYRTIHSWLKLRESYDEETGEISYVEDKSTKGDPPIKELKVLALDETSMLPNDLFNKLVPYMKSGLRVVFIGDPAQIPPVGEKDCYPFQYGQQWGALMCELTEVRRQAAGSPILSYATEIRENRFDTSYQFVPVKQLLADGGGIDIIRFNSIEEQQVLQHYFTHHKFQDNPDFMKVIAWRNDVVNDYNRMIRRFIYKDQGMHLPNIMVGEKLVMDKPFIINSRSMIPNNEEIEVLNLMESQKEVEYADHWNVKDTEVFKVYKLYVRYFMDGEEKRADLDVIHEDSGYAFTKLIDKLISYAQEAPQVMRGRMWAQRYKTAEKFGWVKYNYAITGHKSQGSTYDNSMILQWDIEYNRRDIVERNRILYVACTRAKHLQFIEL
jgi:ATP-dependent exoDNAse (exonuclease V) alpha subunit